MKNLVVPNVDNVTVRRRIFNVSLANVCVFHEEERSNGCTAIQVENKARDKTLTEDRECRVTQFFNEARSKILK